MAAPTLGEFVKGLSEAEFRSDVQLSSYHRDENSDLVNSYIFTSKASEGKKSSAELLKLLAEAYMPGNVPNRFTIIANYGHGKSHFALMLANYFGKPSSSPETAVVLDKLEHALEDRAEYGFFQSFKENGRHPFLVLTLRGDEPGDLRSKFFRALDESRQWYPELESVSLPFWFAEAERFLEGIPQDLSARAEAFLKPRNLDLPLLLEQVQRKDDSAQPICRELHKQLYGTYPDFGADASIREAVEWTADNLCGPDKPVERLLVVFDEFGAFIRDYSLGASRGPGTPLQDLLNGIENRRGKSAFVALTQQDPDAIARSTLTSGFQGDDTDSLLKELNRLPDSERYILHSSLELVLDAYLKQSNEIWEALVSKPAFSRAVSEATEITFRAFTRRYKEDFGWNFSQFIDVMTKGCFPLHPLTTALLSTLQLRSTAAAPRTVLGFVIRTIEDRSEEPAVQGDQPNWVWPITLVDYFKDGLEQKPYQDFIDAMQQAGGPDASEEQRAVLKAMLLQIAGQVETQGTGYDTTIVQLCGLPKQIVERTLNELSDSGVVRREPDGRFYTFWPAGRGAHKVEELLQKKLHNKSLDRRTLDKVGDLLRGNGQMQPLSVNVPWGHPDDWYADQVLLSYSDLEQTTLLNISAGRLQWHLDGKQKPRALVAWLLAETDEQVENYRRRSASVLDQTFGDSPAPLTIVRSQVPRPELSRLILELYGLSQFDNMDIKDVGQDQYEDRRRRTLSRLSEMLGELGRNGEYEVAKALRARVRTVHQKLDSLLPEILKGAYYQGPREFFTQYKLSNAKLRNAVATVGSHLYDNTLDAPKAFQNDPIARQVVDLFLRGKWSLVNVNLRLKEPAQGSPLYLGWKALDDHFVAGSSGKGAKLILSELLNSPYGYGPNTLTLLFTAWYGYNRHDIELSDKGRLVTVGEIAKDPKKGLKQPKDFLAALNDCAIARRSRSDLARDVEDLIHRVDAEIFSKSDALNGIRQLQDFLEDERSDPNLKPEAESAAQALEQAIEAADEYDQKAERLRSRAEKKRKVRELVDLAMEIGKLPRPSRVKPNEPGPDELGGTLRSKIQSVTETRCKELEHITSVTDYGLHYHELQDDRQVLSNVRFDQLVERVDRALQTLEERKRVLEHGQKDEAILEVLRAIPTEGPLSSLRENERKICNLEFLSEEAKEETHVKAEIIQSEISQLEFFAHELAERVSTVVQHDAVQTLKEDILRRRDLFEGTNEHHDIEQALAGCKILENYFTALGKVGNALPNTPEEFEKQIHDLNNLKSEYEGTLAPAQLESLAEIGTKVKQYANKRTERALAWLDDLERDLEQLKEGGSRRQSAGTELERLLEQLKNPPLFLPSEAGQRLGGCQGEVHQLVDQNQSLQVELHFRQIANRQRQLECLEHLQQLVSET